MNQNNTRTKSNDNRDQGARRNMVYGDSRQFDHEVLDVARVVRVVKGGDVGLDSEHL